MHRTHTCGELRLDHAGTLVTLSGWVQRTRDLGGMTFVDLRDRYGLTQLAFNMDSDAELCTQARKLGREFVVKVQGTVRERESKNNRVPTGDIEIDVTSLEVLNAAKTPPFTIEDETDGGDARLVDCASLCRRWPGRLGSDRCQPRNPAGGLLE